MFALALISVIMPPRTDSNQTLRNVAGDKPIKLDLFRHNAAHEAEAHGWATSLDR